MYDVVMLVLNDVSFDGRVRNEAAALAGAGWRVLVVGTQRATGPLPDRERRAGFDLWRVRYGRFGAGLWRPWRWLRHVIQAAQLFRTLIPLRARAYHAHDFPALILLSLVRALHRDRAALIYDAHELYLFQPRYTSRPARAWHRLTLPLFMRLEGWLARRADGVLALAEGRARLLARWYRLPRPLVILNAVDPVSDDTPAPVDLRAVAGPGRRIVVHTGDIVTRWHALLELVQAVALLPDDVALVFLGQGPDAAEVQRLAETLHIAHRMHLVPPVAPDQVAAVIRPAAAAAIVMRSPSWNIRATLPNKLFEAVGAGVPVVASDQFTLRRMVRRYDLGVCCHPSDPRQIAAALRTVLDEGETRRARVRVAQSVLNRQSEADKLCAWYATLLGERS